MAIEFGACFWLDGKASDCHSGDSGWVSQRKKITINLFLAQKYRNTTDWFITRFWVKHIEIKITTMNSSLPLFTLPFSPFYFSSPHPLPLILFLLPSRFSHPLPSSFSPSLPSRCFFPSQLVDLGWSLLGQRSAPGCPAPDCASKGLTCGLHGR